MGRIRAGVGHWSIKLIISLLLIGGVVSAVGLTALLEIFYQARLPWFFSALGIIALANLIASLRWWLLAGLRSIPLSVWQALRLHFIGMFFNNLLPTGFGGDAIRIILAQRQGLSAPEITASILMERLTALWALGLLGFGAVLLRGDLIPPLVSYAMLLTAMLVALASLVLLWPFPLQRLAQCSQGYKSIYHTVDRLHKTLTAYAQNPLPLLFSIGVALGYQMLIVIAAWCLAQSLGLSVSIWVLMTIIPVALLATTLPISLNGFGVRELVWSALLLPVGIPIAQAVSFSLSTVFAAMVVSLLGAAAWIFAPSHESMKKKRLQETQPPPLATPGCSKT
jgi:uncharacterized protein (TIRG00374 family)